MGSFRWAWSPAQTSILGSLFANALLVLGVAIVAGGTRAADGCMRFGARLPNDTAILLLLASFTIVVLGLSDRVGDRAEMAADSSAQDGRRGQTRRAAAARRAKTTRRAATVGRSAGRNRAAAGPAPPRLAASPAGAEGGEKAASTALGQSVRLHIIRRDGQAGRGGAFSGAAAGIFAAGGGAGAIWLGSGA